ncbi:MAG: PA2778 family cysteine peptidase [Gammaproteobacteria bacterium]
MSRISASLRLFFVVSLLTALVLLAGCASRPGRQVLRDADTAVELKQVPFFAQQEFQCGPAALATVLQADDVAITPEQLVPEIYVPGRKGSLQAELLAATRRHGRIPYVLPPALAPVLAELRAGRPVLVLQNLGLRRWPLWHYAVLVGFDPGNESFLLRSGEKSRLQVSARAFLASWERGDHWAMVVTSPSTLPASADATRWLQAVAPFESTGRFAEASAGYEVATTRWPHDAAAWTALGNVRYRQQRMSDAEQAWREAIRHASTSTAGWVARNNLAELLLDRHCPQQAQALLDEAGTPPPSLVAPLAATRQRIAEAGNADCH